LDNKPLKNNNIDLEVAKREFLKTNKNKKLFIIAFLTSISFISGIIIKNNNFSISLINDNNLNSDSRVLGHFPFNETPSENLIQISSNILVHKDMYKSLLKMKEDAKSEGVYLVFLSGYRSIKLQEEIFYSLKSIRNQNASERAKVSAPPGYSEHSTGFAIDIGDALNRETDFEVEFENTNAFKWLRNNAAKYHFKLSFDRNHASVDYEPWHWRYEGSIKALKIFEPSNRNFRN